MGVPILILGKSGSGKSTSLRDFPECGIINVLGKPLPFRGAATRKSITTDDYEMVKAVLVKSKAKSIAIDDAGFLMTNQFMRGHAQQGAGSAIFGFYNTIGDSFWNLIEYVIHTLPADVIVYFMMHEDKNDMGEVKPKSVGKMLDEKVCIESMFTIALRCVLSSGKHVFKTQTDGTDVTKSPDGMFEMDEIPNDLAYVDKTVRAYYGFVAEPEEKPEAKQEEAAKP